MGCSGESRDARCTPGGAHELHRAKVALLIINVLGGAVLGSYVDGFLAHPRSASALWGNVPAFLLPFYTASMLAAAAGYLAFTFFILVRLDPDETMIAGRFSYRAFLWLYAAILAPSALWMPLTFAILAAPSPVPWVVIRIVLAIVGLAALALLVALLGTRPGSHVGPAGWLSRLDIVSHPDGNTRRARVAGIFPAGILTAQWQVGNPRLCQRHNLFEITLHMFHPQSPELARTHFPSWLQGR